MGGKVLLWLKNFEIEGKKFNFKLFHFFKFLIYFPPKTLTTIEAIKTTQIFLHFPLKTFKKVNLLLLKFLMMCKLLLTTRKFSQQQKIKIWEDFQQQQKLCKFFTLVSNFNGRVSLVSILKTKKKISIRQVRKLKKESHKAEAWWWKFPDAWVILFFMWKLAAC